MALAFAPIVYEISVLALYNRYELGGHVSRHR